jgi:hypothetical protein
MPRVRLSSLLLVEERLLEAEYFSRRLRRLSGEPFGYELNAFLSAARSVTFLMQKEWRTSLASQSGGQENNTS